MKICLYTVSDFKPNTIDCIDLLLSSIIKNINYDFYIVSPYSYNCKYNVIRDASRYDYIGALKYSNLLPTNYDYYIYIDSDILYFDTISSMFSEDKLFSVVRENTLINNNDWYYFQYIQDQNEKNKIQACKALNAGFFGFRKDQINIIHTINALYRQYSKNNIDHDVKLEQSLWNYTLYTKLNYSLDSCYDLTNTLELFASHKTKPSNKRMYHFCGFTNEMSSKYFKMKVFYDRYK